MIPTISQDKAPKISDKVSDALETFKPIQNYVFFVVLRYLPSFILLFAVGEVVIGNCTLADNSMYYSGLLSSAISLLFFSSLIKQIPYTLGTLWNRKIIGLRDEALSDSGEIKMDSTLKTDSNSPSKLEKQYVIFIRKFQDLLNSPYQWVFALAFSALPFSWYDNRWSFNEKITEHLIAFVIGFMAWRMIITGIQVWQLGRKFDINVQLGHPDECGGLAPLGNLCLWNALILSVAGIFLGGWIIIMPSTQYIDVSIYGDVSSRFYKLLLIPVGWAVVSFFIPLWSVHNVLVAKREEVQLQLNQIGQKINQLSHEILDRCQELGPEESEKISKKLAILQRTYQQYKNYPVWPFNADLIKKLTLSQTVQLLSLTGLGQPILKVVKIIVDTINDLSP